MIKKYMKERRGLIIFILVAAVFVTWGVINITNARKNAVESNFEYMPAEGNVDFNEEGWYKTVAATENLELLYNEAKGAIQLKDLSNDYVWKSVVDDEVYDTSKMNKQWSAYLKSILTVSYNDLSKRDAPPTKVYSAQDCNYLETNYLDNGVSVTYGFTQAGIYLNVEYLLEEGEFVVRIPAEKIKEETQYVITSMEILPFFGSAGDDVDGYLVYPDGSGAITSYVNVSDRSANVKAGMWRTYTNRTVSMDELLLPENYERYTASLPVYGIKNDNNALFAAFTKGAENSGVVGYPSGYVVNLNHIGFEIYTRNVFDVDMFNISSAANETSNGKEIQRVDREIINEDREIRFFLLSGKDANYSKMADVYRNYLLDTNQLSKVIQEDDTMPLALEFIMGVTKPQMIFDEYVKMTSISDILEILDRLKSNNILDTQILLRSWQEDGENYPNYWPIASKLGGEKGLKSLDAYLNENQRNKLYLENNFIFAVQENGGFSATKDVAYDGLNLPISGGIDETWYLLNPQVAYEKSNNFLTKLTTYSDLGAAYQYMGRIVYPDYNKEQSFTRSETVNMWKNIFSNTKDKNIRLASEGMNQYTFENADYLYHVNEGSFGLSITDSSIPFVQMVVSGLIPYSTEPGNLSYDIEIQKLKWIEYGALPHFVLTYEDAIQLKETDFDDIFTSTYNVWEDRVVAIYKEFKENFQDIYGKQMILHETVGDGVVRIGYEGGITILLNYNKEEVKVGGEKVPAKSYVITGKEGQK